MSENQVVPRDVSFVSSQDELVKLVSGVNSDDPDPEAIDRLREYFKNVPKLWPVFGDMGEKERVRIIERMHGSKVKKLAAETGVELLREGLGHADAPALECILIDHSLTCWLRLQEIEWRYGAITSESLSFKQAEFWEKRLNAVQRRFLRACETLARVRKITRQTVALQVNIATDGGQQAIVQGDVTR